MRYGCVVAVVVSGRPLGPRRSSRIHGASTIRRRTKAAGASRTPHKWNSPHINVSKPKPLCSAAYEINGIEWLHSIGIVLCNSHLRNARVGYATPFRTNYELRQRPACAWMANRETQLNRIEWHLPNRTNIECWRFLFASFHLKQLTMRSCGGRTECDRIDDSDLFCVRPVRTKHIPISSAVRVCN